MAGDSATAQNSSKLIYVPPPLPRRGKSENECGSACSKVSMEADLSIFKQSPLLLEMSLALGTTFQAIHSAIKFFISFILGFIAEYVVVQVPHLVFMCSHLSEFAKAVQKSGMQQFNGLLDVYRKRILASYGAGLDVRYNNPRMIFFLIKLSFAKIVCPLLYNEKICFMRFQVMLGLFMFSLPMFTSIAMEKRNSEAQTFLLLKEAVDDSLITSNHISTGFTGLADVIDDLSLAILHAKDVLSHLVSRAIEKATAGFQEYFLSDAVGEFIKSLADLSSSLLNAVFVKQMVTLAMDSWPWAESIKSKKWLLFYFPLFMQRPYQLRMVLKLSWKPLMILLWTFLKLKMFFPYYHTKMLWHDVQCYPLTSSRENER